MTDATALGRDIWLMLRETFDEAASADGFGSLPEKGQVWAGFIAAASGGMCAQIGSDSGRAILAAVSDACVNVSRTKLTLVKP